MKSVYIVKSFSPENGYVNLKAFTQLSDAENYLAVIEKQIPADIVDEFVEIETLNLL
jgi:hypothetical protein